MEEINDDLIKLLNEYNIEYSRLKQSLPYHLNVIDELHINENAHSRILCKLLQYQSESGKYDFLESLLNYIVKNKSVESFSNIEIKSPKITQEIERIDLWVKDKDYAIIFENKVYDANDQEAQIARYINKTKVCDFEYEKIYVIYMPSTGECEASEQTWIDNSDPKNPKDLKENFQERYVKLSFREDILDWLKEHVLPNIKYKDQYLLNAILQYIDYLEGLFDKRNINKIMNMELNQFLEKEIKRELKTNGEVSAEKKLEILTRKEGEIQNLLNFINEKKKDVNNIIVIDKWGRLTENTFKTIAEEVAEIMNKEGYQIESRISYNQETSELWIQFYQEGWDLSIIIAKKEHPDHSAFIYIGKQNERNVDEKYYAGQKIFNYRSAAEKPSHPYGWEWIDSYHYKPIAFYNAIMDGSFKEYLKGEVSKILGNIKEYNLSMS